MWPNDRGVASIEHAPAVEVDALGREVGVDVGAERGVGSTEMVAGVEARQRAQRARERGDVVEVDQPGGVPVREPVLHPLGATVRDARAVEARPSPLHPQRGGGADTREAAVFVEAPPVVRAGEREPVVAQARQ